MTLRSIDPLRFLSIYSFLIYYLNWSQAWPAEMVYTCIWLTREPVEVAKRARKSLLSSLASVFHLQKPIKGRDIEMTTQILPPPLLSLL